MTEKRIKELLEGTYITNLDSREIRVSFVDGKTVRGKFIKALQFKSNALANKWMLSYKDGSDALIDGSEILSLQNRK